MGQAQLARPTTRPLGRPMPWGRASARMARDGMAWPHPARPVLRLRRRLNDGGNSKILEGKRTPSIGIHAATLGPT
jgi:hypothetical protein